MSTTVVTCYYIIPNKRTHEKYLQWIKNFLKVPCNMYIFTDENTVQILRSIRRESYNTYYHILPLDKFYVCKYDDLWNFSLVIDIEKQNENVNHTTELYKIWAEKIFMCREAIFNNVFNSQIFCWSDIGSIRQEDMFPVVYSFPLGLCKSLNKEKIMLSAVIPIESSDFIFNEDGISHLFQNISPDKSCLPKNKIQGGFFAGYIESLLKYAEMFDNELELFRKTKTFGGKDQYVMTNIYLKNSDAFQVINSFTREYYWDEWFNYLLRFSNVPLVTCKIEGGLGNQLFQISHALCLAWKNNCLPIFQKIKPPVDISDRPSYWGTMFHSLLSISPFINTEWKVITEYGNAFNVLDKVEVNTMIQGYWQTSKYFYEYRDILREVFKIPEEIKAKLIKIIPSNCTAIHIRRTDYIKLRWNLPVEYYRQCIGEELQRDNNINFLIFSDDHDWCRENFPNIPIFNQGDEIEQLYAISLCDNVIMANSSFCWWGVFLNKNSKHVYCPEPWFPSFQTYNLDIYEYNWNRRKVNF